MSPTLRLNQAPPISKRPKCAGCGNPLAPRWELVNTRSVPYGKSGVQFQNTVEFRGKYHAYGAFCTLRCACDFANKCVASRTAPAP